MRPNEDDPVRENILSISELYAEYSARDERIRVDHQESHGSHTQSRTQSYNPGCRCIIIIAILATAAVVLTLIITLSVTLTRKKDGDKTAPEATTVTTTTITIPDYYTAITGSTEKRKCFDGNSFAIREDGSRVFLRDLKVGESILVARESSDGEIFLRPSPVLAIDVFQKYNRHLPIHYLEIVTITNTSGEPLRITPQHSLFVKKENQLQPKFAFASEVNIGDELYIVSKDDVGYATAVKVVNIREIERLDAYAPLTLEGNLVVNDVVVSCYGRFSHSSVHRIMAMRRWLLHYCFHTLITLMGHEAHVDTFSKYLTSMDIFNLSVRDRIQFLIGFFDS